MLEGKCNSWRGYIRKIGMIGLMLLLILPNMLMGTASQIFANEADYDILVVDDTITIVAYLGTDTNVEIPDQIQGKDVTVIANQAFMGKKMSKVTIPETVTTIGAAAFFESELDSVVLNEGLLEIGLMAFAGSKMETVDIPGTVTTIAEGAFSQGSLKTVTLREGLKTIKDEAFWDNELQSVTIPEGVTTIGKEAFINNLLEEVTLPGTIISMGKEAFLGGEDGGNIIHTLTLQEGLSSIGESAFRDNLLESVHIPGTVSVIETAAFMGNAIKTLILNEGVEIIGEQAFEQNLLEEVVIPGTVTHIAGSAFYRNEINRLTLPESVEKVGAAAFGFNPLTEVTIYNDEVEFEMISVVVPPFFGDLSEPSGGIKFFARSGSTTETMILALPPEAGFTFEVLEESGPAVCGEGTYFECVVNDDDTITITGYDEDAPKYVVIPDTIDGKVVTHIGRDAFYLLQLTGVELPNDLISIGEFAFCWNAITTVTIPSGVTFIGYSAFKTNQLESVFISDSVTYIEEYAFHDNLLTEVTIPNGVDYIEMFAFSKNPLKIIRFEGAPTEITFDAFPHVGAYEYPNFKGWYTDENFNDEWDNFVTAPMTIYGKWEYTVSFETSGGTTVGDQTVGENGTITIPDAPTKTGDVFEGWYVDEELTTLWDFDQGVTEDMTLYAKWTAYYCGYGTDFECVERYDGTITITGYTGTSKDVVIPETINGKSVTVIEGSVYVGVGAFAKMDLESVTIPNSVTVIGNYAFHKNKLEAVHIPGSVKVIGDHSFDENNLESVVFSEGLEMIGTNAFYANKLKKITIPNTVIMVGYGAFIDNEIDELTLAEGLQTIDEFAFGINQLQTVTIPESVTSIGKGAFINNILEKFTVLGTTVSIDLKIFALGTLPNPQGLTIRSYCGSTANEIANLLGHSFEQLEANECLTITLTPSETVPTNEDVTVTIDVVNGEASEVELKWAKGDNDLALFQDGDGANVTESQFTVTENGVYTVYAKDKAGNERVDTITIANIDKSLLIIHVQVGDEETITLHVYGSDSIQQLKQKIQDEAGIEPENQNVIFAGTVLVDGRTLADYNIPSGETLQLDVLSSDASLNQLGVELKGERAFELDLPNFDHDIGKTEKATIEIIATANDANAKVTLNGVSFDENELLPLNKGENTFTMIVTAENGHEQTYTIIVYRQAKAPSQGGGVYTPSSDISLDRLEVIVDGENILPFELTQFEYDLGDTEAETVEIIVKTHDPKAKIILDGEAFADKKTLLLNEGKNIFELVIVAENGDKQIYTITVNRLEKVPFIDIAGHWAEGYIKKSYWGEIFYGYPDKTFRPDDHISRMEVTSVLVRLLELDEKKQVPFIDVQSIGKAAMEELEKAYANGVVKGYQDQTFKPYADVTRAHLALLFYRTYEKVNGTPYKPKQLAYFPDIAGYDQETQNAIAMLVELNMAEGTGGSFMPSDQATRAQAAKMLVKFKEVLGCLENK